MNYEKIAGNFLVSFGTAFLAASWVGGFDALMIAMVNSVVIGALAVGKELQDAKCKKKGVIPCTDLKSRVLNASVLL